jgi:hypothetical protein
MNLTVYNGSVYSFNPHNTQEIAVETSGTSAENFTGGVRVNIVPKDGGNSFSGSFSFTYSNRNLQSSNLTDKLRGRGLVATPSLKQSYEVGGSLGGPIKKDKLWFFTAHRKWLAARFIPGNFYNKTQGTLFYTPDLNRPAFTNDFYQDHSLRLTWQLSAKDKVAVSYSGQDNCNCPIDNLGGGATRIAPEAAGLHYYQPNWFATVTWSRPATNRLLLEGGASTTISAINSKPLPEVGPSDIAVTDLAINTRYNARANNIGNTCCYSTNAISHQFTERFAVSYITGSHGFKTGVSVSGFTFRHNATNAINQIHGARAYTVRNGVPTQVTIFATPFGRVGNTTTVGIFAQDQWTVRRLTLNLGVRYDSFNAWAPAQAFPAGLFVPARDLPEVRDVPDWKNLNPRLGVAYDLFGIGRTALKAALGRYVIGTSQNSNFPLSTPITNQAASANRTWNDLNGNQVPDCVLDARIPEGNGECGALSDRTFGQVSEGNTRYAHDALTGLNDSQSYNWQGSISLQHELRPGIAVSIGYFRTWFGNFLATDNLALTPANFDRYCVTAPVDSRLPGGGGQQVCGLYDIQPTVFGQVDNLVTQTSNYGTQREVYSGIDALLNARFGQGGQFSGGLSTAQTVTDTCDLNNLPQVQPLNVGGQATSTTVLTPRLPGFCRISRPWAAATQVKFLVVYPLPWNLRTSAIYQNVPGIPITASYVANNAQIAPLLGRNLGACRGSATCNATATIELIPTNTVFEDRIQQVDLRFARTFRVGKVRMEGNLDIYNLFNASPILSMNTRFGPEWLNAQEILAGRLIRFGAQINF